MLRIVAAGSVDDGKSSLIGRLLYDTETLFDDQLAAVERASRARGREEIELALITDGLRAEREQNITIDVAYRYFSTPRRTFVLADAPGHEQYTRNMATGASTADLMILLVDVERGVLPQTRRHAAIANLFGIRHVAVAVNKMDRVGWDEDSFRSVAEEVAALDLPDIRIIPISALLGDNVARRSERMPFYTGPALLEHLETIDIAQDASRDLRFPVQTVLRGPDGSRWLAGTVVSGVLEPGPVRAYPGGMAAVEAILGPDGPVERAEAGAAVAARLDRDLDLGRGSLLASVDHPPAEWDRFRATVCWFGDRPAEPGDRLILAHGPRRVAARIESVDVRLELETMRHEAAERLGANDIGEVTIVAAEPLFADAYADNRATGAAVLIRPLDFATVGAAMILGPA